MRELKRQGKCDVNHHEPTSQEDLETVYKYFERCTEDNVILQHMVYFDLSLYHLRDLRKEHFAVNKDSAGLRYLYAVQSESTKNHQSDHEDNFSKGRMYEIPGSDLYPLKSYEFYLSKLCNGLDLLFQQPNKLQFMENTFSWYHPVPLGHNTLGNMMATVSGNAQLSCRYTNHCLRATAITILDAANFASRHIMTFFWTQG